MFAKEVIKKGLRELNEKENLTEEEKGFKAGYKRSLELIEDKKTLKREMINLMDKENTTKFDWGKIKKMRSTIKLLNK